MSGLQDGSLPFARSIKDIHSEFRLLSKLTELLMKQGEQEEALQYATLAVQIASKTGKSVTYSRVSALWLLVNFQWGREASSNERRLT